MPKTTLSWNEMRERAYAFVREWKDETSERAEAQSSWTDWFNIFGLKRRGTIAFEQAAKRDSTGRQGRLDAFWPKHLAIEHKSAGKSLEEAIGQACDYLGSVEHSQWPRYVMSSDFQNFLVLDLETSEKIAFPLTELPQRLELFGWVAGYERRSFAKEDEVSVHAAELMGRLYDLLNASGYGGHDSTSCSSASSSSCSPTTPASGRRTASPTTCSTGRQKTARTSVRASAFCSRCSTPRNRNARPRWMRTSHASLTSTATCSRRTSASVSYTHLTLP